VETWLRCALHAHTTRSDGELEPEELIAQYEAAEFDVLAITDHWIRTEADSTDGLLLIPSSELSCRLPDWPDTHLLAFGIDQDPMEFVRTRPDLREAATWVADHGVRDRRRRRHRGLQCRVRAGDGTRRFDRALGRPARARRSLLRDRG
jgi:hypothetical protein